MSFKYLSANKITAIIFICGTGITLLVIGIIFFLKNMPVNNYTSSNNNNILYFTKKTSIIFISVGTAIIFLTIAMAFIFCYKEYKWFKKNMGCPPNTYHCPIHNFII